MNYYHYSLLLILQVTGWTMISLGIQPIQPTSATETLYLAQTPRPTPIDPLKLLNPYDTYMQEGYAATRDKNYEKALESFKKALAEKPNDIYAQQAIQNIENYIKRDKNSVKSGNALLKWLIPVLAVGGVGAIALAVWLFRKSPQKSDFKEKNSEKNPFFTDATPETPPFSSGFPPEGRGEDADIWDTSLPVQRTTRIPNADLIEELIKELQNPQPKKRRRAIWKLAQNADSRAMKPLVELMIDADSYERNLILEALSQISTRTIKPMNQALALSLQDKNPQVRKNAIRDLTRLYDMMSQVSQLLCHAIDDTDDEVQATARWALNQLNLQMPPRMDLLINKDNSNVEPEVMNNHAEAAEVDYP